MRDRRLLVLDAVAVVAFVVIGRRSHGGSDAVVAVARTAAPFLVGLAVGWALARVDRDPVPARAGAVIALVTVGVGMALRRLLFGDGTAATFVIVTTVFLVVTMVGWRVVVHGLERRRHRVHTP